MNKSFKMHHSNRINEGRRPHAIRQATSKGKTTAYILFRKTGLDCYVTYKKKSDLVLILFFLERKKILKGSSFKAKERRRRRAKARGQLATEE
jgi:hypothetical protein